MKKIHFIGIGGIGLSALAKFLFNDGHKISGSDIKQTEITNDLATNFNAKITIPHHADAVEGVITSYSIHYTKLYELPIEGELERFYEVNLADFDLEEERLKA